MNHSKNNNGILKAGLKYTFKAHFVVSVVSSVRNTTAKLVVSRKSKVVGVDTGLTTLRPLSHHFPFARHPKSFTIRTVLAILAVTFVLPLFLTTSDLPLATSVAKAQTPNTTLNFQARILTSAGALVADGNYNLEFKIYDSSAAGGTAQGVCSLNSSTDDCWWLETRTGANVVRVVNGYISVNLGSVTAFGSSIPWSQDLYVTMRVGGIGTPSWDTTEMTNATTGRMKISSVPLAFVANNVKTANRTSANSDNITVQTGDTTTSGTAGNVSIDVGTSVSGTPTINIGANTNSILKTITIGGSTQTGSITLGSSSGAQSVLIGNGAGAATLSEANATTAGVTYSLAGAANTVANSISIANGASAANSTVSILSGAGTAGVGTLSLGNNTRVTTIDLGNVANVANRITTIAGGNTPTGISDTINIGTGSTVGTGTKVIHIGDGTPAGTNTITIGSTAATANVTVLQGGTGTGAGTEAIRLNTNATNGSIALKSGTTSGAINLNASNNSATNINTGTSTGAVAIGNSAAGTITLQSASTIGMTGTTSITGLSAGAGTALTVNNSTSTGSIFVAQDNGTAVLTVADGGAILAKNSVNSTTAFQIQDSAGASLFTLDTTNQILYMAAQQESIDQYNNSNGGIGQTQNFLTFSEQFNNAAWTATGITVAADSVAGPDNYSLISGGPTTADTLTASAASGTVVQTYTTGTNGNYTFSVWLKTASGTQSAQLRIDSTGATPTSGTPVSITATTTWQRYFVTQNFTGTPTNIKPTIVVVTNGGAIYAYGAQLNQGTQELVYLRTTTTSFPFLSQGVVSNGGVIAVSLNASDVPLGVQAAPGQTANLLGILSSANANLFSVSSAGLATSNTGFAVGASSGSNTTCTGGNVLSNPVVTGGIITGGSCSAAGSGTITGSGTANQVAYFSGTSALTSGAALTYNGGQLAVNNTSATVQSTLNVFANNATNTANTINVRGYTGEGIVIQPYDAVSRAAISVRNSAGAYLSEWRMTGEFRASDTGIGHSFLSDSTTGLGRTGASALALYTGNVARLSVDSSGNTSLSGNLSLTASTAVLSIADAGHAAGANMLAVGDDTYLSDVDVAHTLGIYSSSNTALGAVRFGSGGGYLNGANGAVGASAGGFTPGGLAAFEVRGGFKSATTSDTQHTWLPYTDGYNYISGDVTYIRTAAYTTMGTFNSTGLTLAGLLNAGNYVQVNGKYAIDGTDTWLRLNQQNSFTSGTYTPYLIRADGGFYVGSGGGQIQGSATQTIVYSPNTAYAMVADNTGIYLGQGAATGNLHLCYGGFGRIEPCTSSRTLKHNIVDTTYGLSQLRQLRPVQYAWNADGRLDAGFIAEEVATVVPEATQYNTDGSVKSFSMDPIVSVLAKSLQQLDVQVQANVTRLAVVETGNFAHNIHVAGYADITGNLTVHGDTTLTKLTVTGDTEVQKLTVNGKIITAGAVPTVVLGTQATGNGAVITLTGNDTAGTINYDAGVETLPTNPLASGAQVGVTFTSAYALAPRIALTAKDADSAAMRYYVETTATGFIVHFLDTPKASATYAFDYIVIQ